MNYRIAIKSELDIGLMINKFMKINTPSIEPRISWATQVNKKYRIVVASGITSRDIPFSKYSYRYLADVVKPMKSLQLSNSHQLMFKNGFKIKLEAFYQYMWNVYLNDTTGISTILNSIHNDVYAFNGFLSDKGKGKNYGLEYTFSKEFNKATQVQLAGSLFRSLYRGEYPKWRNTRFDNKYNVAFGGSKEWVKQKEYGLKKITLSCKVLSFGGFFSPKVLMDSSKIYGQVIYENNYLYEYKTPNYFRADLGLQINYSKKRVRHEIRLDLQNITNRKNALGYDFNYDQQQVVFTYQLRFIPVLTYGIYF